MDRNKWADTIPAPLCIAPWKALSIDFNGNVSPDQIFKGVMGNLNTQTLDEIWNSEEWKSLRQSHINFHNDTRCRKCFHKEELTGHSRRRFFESFFGSRLPKEDLEEIIYPDRKGNLDPANASNRPKIRNYDEPDFIYLDINGSNKCNLKCIHCSSSASTGWIPDEKKIKKYLDKNPEAWPIGTSWPYMAVDSNVVDNLFDNKEYFENLQFVALRGGEPFYEKKNLYVLQKLISLGWNERITLDISTNATVLDPAFLDLLKQFKRVVLYISLEGIGKLYSYCRGGKNFDQGHLDKAVEYFASIDNVELCLAYTTMAPNIFNVRSTWDWFQQYKDISSITFSNTVSEPRYLSLDVLSNEIKKEAYDMIKDIDDDLEWPFDNADFVYSAGIWKLSQTLSEDTEEKDIQENLWNNYVNFTNYLDSIRGTNFLEAEPMYRKYWNE